MGNVSNKQEVDFKAFHFEAAEKALTLKNSRGSKQGRLHLFDYKGIEGKDRYAVAAEIVTGKFDGLAPELGWLDRKYYILHAQKEDNGTLTWYKINKNSLVKRLGIQESELCIADDYSETVCTNLIDLVSHRKIWIEFEKSDQRDLVREDGHNFKDVGEELKRDKDFILSVIYFAPVAFQYVSNKFKKDKDFVLKIVKANGLALEHVHKDLRDDEDVVLEAIASKTEAFKNASSRLKKDRAFVLQAVQKNGRVLEFVDDKFKNDEEIVRPAVKQNSYALKFASDDLKDNEDVVLDAVNKDGMALVHASDNMKKNKKVALAAIKQNWMAYFNVSQTIVNDTDIQAAINASRKASQKKMKDE